MTSRDFCYWLQGYFEIEKKRAGVITMLGAEQVQCIAEHLALVFVHEIDPSAGDAVEQAKLSAIHAGVSKEEVQTAIKEALSKLPKPGPPGGPVMRC